MPLVSGVEKRVVIAKESTWGTKPAANTGREVRRVTAEFNKERATFQSNEITSTAQTSDMRSGTDNITGGLNCELSPNSYTDILASLLRGTWVAGATVTATTIAAAAGKFTRSAGSWLTDGFKVGDLVTVSGFTTTATANNKQWLVSAVTSTDLSVVEREGEAVVVKAAGDSVTVAVAGKKLAIPLTPASRTDDSYTVEEYFAAHGDAYITTGVKFGSAAISVQPNQMATINFGVMGRTQTVQTGAYFTSPTAPTTTSVLAGSKGALLVDGVRVATVTGLSVDLTGNMETSLVIGQRQAADVALGRIGATGQFTAFFEDKTIYQKFDAETEVSLVFWLEGDAGESVVLKFPRIKLSGANRDDKETGNIIQTVPFTALLPKTNTNVEQSTVVIQDTLVV